jgi:aquaporin NIP
MMTLPLRRAAAEFLGTFALVFAGTGAIIIDQSFGHPIGHAGISAVFGLIVLAMIHTFGDVSGAHMNPAVTVAFSVAGRFPWRQVPGYAAAQFSGACSASLLLRLMFPQSEFLGGTQPSGGFWQSFTLEVVMTALLMLVVLSVSTGGKEKGNTAGFVIGAVVGLEALFGGPVSGASMNPVRSLAPALISGHLESTWLYLIATFSGALLAVPLCRIVRGPACCDSQAANFP